MEKQHAKKFLKKYITVTGGPAVVDALDDENKTAKAKEFVKKYFTVVGGPEAIEAAAKQEHYLTMTLPEGSTTTQISIKKQGEPVGTNFQYRVNNGKWIDWDFTSSQAISAKANDVIQWKGVNHNGLSTDSDNDYVYFEIPNEVHLSGNVMSLIDGIGETKVIPCEYCFCYLFEDTKIKTVSEDFLPATTLAESCYYQMFNGCTKLVNAPELPATTLAGWCYQSMFEGCTSLVTAPSLPATTLTEGCYYSMFGGCTSLVNAPALNATTLADSCYEEMFYGCTNLQNVTCLATDISATDCTSSWLAGVASTGTFNKAAGVTWYKGVNGIPEGWTVIGQGPEPEPEPGPEPKYLTMTLPEGSTTTQISIKKQGEPVGTNFQYRVNNGKWIDWDFTSSQAISAKANDVIQWKGVNHNGLSTDSDNDYVYFEIPNEVHLSGNVMSLIDGIGETKVIPCEYCFCYLFEDTKIKTVSEDFLPATTLAESCYYQMFNGCTKLVNAPELPATTLAGWCYQSMFEGCTSLVTAPSLPATTLTEGCYYSMFGGCTSLVNAPALNATTLADSCYEEMFYGCTNLQNVTCLATDISATDCTSSWLAGVASTGTFNKAAGVTWSKGVNGIPSGWTVNEYVQPAEEPVEQPAGESVE